MAGGSSSKCTISPLNGENFKQWSELMYQLLYKEGLLSIVENGLEKQDAENDDIRINRMQDHKAKAIILEHLSDDQLLMFYGARTSKELWDRLQRKYNPKGKMKERHQRIQQGKVQLLSARETHSPVIEKEVPRTNEEGPSEPVIEKEVPRTNEEGPSEPVRIICQSCSGRNAASSRESNFINLILTKNAFEPKFQLRFPNEVREMLPSTNIIAQVSCNGETYNMKFYGQKDPKWLGSGWRKFVEDHELKTGDSLEFEIVKSMNSELHLKLTMYKEKGYVPRRFRYIVYSDESDED